MFFNQHCMFSYAKYRTVYSNVTSPPETQASDDNTKHLFYLINQSITKQHTAAPKCTFIWHVYIRKMSNVAIVFTEVNVRTWKRIKIQRWRDRLRFDWKQIAITNIHPCNKSTCMHFVTIYLRVFDPLTDDKGSANRRACFCCCSVDGIWTRSCNVVTSYWRSGVVVL